MLHAEKTVTGVQRGTANPRWRDYADFWTHVGRHRVTAVHLQRTSPRLPANRGVRLRPLAQVLHGYAELARVHGRRGADAAVPRACPTPPASSCTQSSSSLTSPDRQHRPAPGRDTGRGRPI